MSQLTDYNTSTSIILEICLILFSKWDSRALTINSNVQCVVAVGDTGRRVRGREAAARAAALPAAEARAPAAALRRARGREWLARAAPYARHHAARRRHRRSALVPG